MTVAGIKQQIAALEAKAERIAADEMKSSVSRVRSLMEALGVTLEHLGAHVTKTVKRAKSAAIGKKSSAAKRSGAGAARYRDPATGATWSGFGRAPRWIASAANRDDYLVNKVAPAKAAKSAVKKPPAAGKGVASAAKRIAGTAKAVPVKAARPKAAKETAAAAKRSAKKPAAPKSAATPAKRGATKVASRKVKSKAIATPVSSASPGPVAAPASE